MVYIHKMTPVCVLQWEIVMIKTSSSTGHTVGVVPGHFKEVFFFCSVLNEIDNHSVLKELVYPVYYYTIFQWIILLFWWKKICGSLLSRHNYVRIKWDTNLLLMSQWNQQSLKTDLDLLCFGSGYVIYSNTIKFMKYDSFRWNCREKSDYIKHPSLKKNLPVFLCLANCDSNKEVCLHACEKLWTFLLVMICFSPIRFGDL